MTITNQKANNKIQPKSCLKKYNHIDKTNIPKILWKAFISANLNDKGHKKKLMTDYRFIADPDEVPKYFRGHQKRMIRVYNAVTKNKEPLKEDWDYIQDYLVGHLEQYYNYKQVKLNQKENKIVIRRVSRPLGVMAAAYLSFMEALLAAINGENLGYLSRGMKWCEPCKRFFDPKIFGSNRKYCSDTCREAEKNKARKAKYKKSKE